MKFNKIRRLTAKLFGKYHGFYLQRKQGFGPELWKIEVYEFMGQLYGGDKFEDPKYLHLMLESHKDEILNKVKKKNET